MLYILKPFLIAKFDVQLPLSKTSVLVCVPSKTDIQHNQGSACTEHRDVLCLITKQKYTQQTQK